MPQLVMSPENPNRPADTDQHFRENGDWEKLGGRTHTRIFATNFLKHIRIPLSEPFTLLDVGCALGDSLPLFHQVYPKAVLYGCDVSANSVRRCTMEHGAYASFFISSVHELDRKFDVIFCSNIIEHIENHLEIVRHLTTLAKVVYVMVPYRELHDGKPISVKLGLWHVATFDDGTFDALKKEGLIVQTSVFRCPGAWGHPLWKLPLAKIKAALLGRTFIDKKQIVYELRKP
jgi:SAM-dependent methyltransferase